MSDSGQRSATPPGWADDWPAPAKINLFLHIVGRRDDGYHFLQTAFRFLDYGDTLRFEVRCDNDVVLANPLPGVAEGKDLTLRAAVALREATDCRSGVTIHLNKRLPLGGGLGGGSSDAATTLLALNHLWQTGLSRHQLQDLGLRLGADVPVFIHGRTVFAEGIGEQFSDIQAAPAWYLVLVPPVAVPTSEIFGSKLLRRDTPTIDPSSWSNGFGINDMETAACALYPAVAECLAWLREYGDARMSGSGACCFVAFADEHSARTILAQRPAGFNGFVARGLDTHPLSSLCDSPEPLAAG